MGAAAPPFARVEASPHRRGAYNCEVREQRPRLLRLWQCDIDPAPHDPYGSEQIDGELLVRRHARRLPQAAFRLERPRERARRRTGRGRHGSQCQSGSVHGQGPCFQVEGRCIADVAAVPCVGLRGRYGAASFRGARPVGRSALNSPRVDCVSAKGAQPHDIGEYFGKPRSPRQLR
jgi:hypothetical protein